MDYANQQRDILGSTVICKDDQPFAIKGVQLPLDSPLMTMWECGACEQPFALYIGHIPMACPFCGRHYTAALIDNQHIPHSEFGLHPLRKDAATSPVPAKQ